MAELAIFSYLDWPFTPGLNGESYFRTIRFTFLAPSLGKARFEQRFSYKMTATSHSIKYLACFPELLKAVAGFNGSCLSIAGFLQRIEKAGVKPTFAAEQNLNLYWKSRFNQMQPIERRLQTFPFLSKQVKDQSFYYSDDRPEIVDYNERLIYLKRHCHISCGFFGLYQGCMDHLPNNLVAIYTFQINGKKDPYGKCTGLLDLNFKTFSPRDSKPDDPHYFNISVDSRELTYIYAFPALLDVLTRFPGNHITLNDWEGRIVKTDFQVFDFSPRYKYNFIFAGTGNPSVGGSEELAPG